jgi:hypothetical protein
MKELNRKRIQRTSIDIRELENAKQFFDYCSTLDIALEEIEIMQHYSDVIACTYSLETDEEYESRIKPYTAKLKKREEAEYKKYLELKAKFEASK